MVSGPSHGSRMTLMLKISSDYGHAVRPWRLFPWNEWTKDLNGSETLLGLWTLLAIERAALYASCYWASCVWCLAIEPPAPSVCDLRASPRQALQRFHVYTLCICVARLPTPIHAVHVSVAECKPIHVPSCAAWLALISVLCIRLSTTSWLRTSSFYDCQKHTSNMSTVRMRTYAFFVACSWCCSLSICRSRWSVDTCLLAQTKIFVSLTFVWFLLAACVEILDIVPYYAFQPHWVFMFRHELSLRSTSRCPS